MSALPKQINKEGKLKLTLVVPNYRWTAGEEHTYYHYVPYNLCCLAAMVEDLCHVEIIDAYFQDMDISQFTEAIRKSNPQIMGITVIMDQFSSTGHRAAEIAKGINPDIHTMLGGVYATMNPEHAAADENIDVVAIGEGEYIIRDLVKHFVSGTPFPEKGVCYRHEGKIVNTGKADFIDDLDALPLPAYHLIPFDEYSNRVTRTASVDAPRVLPYARLYSSRGCPYNCVFCQVGSIAGRKFRARSANRVLDEIEWLYIEYGVRSLIISDDNFFQDRQRVVDILNGLKDRKLTMPWLSEDTAVFLMDRELLELMRETGCEYVGLAIETGNQRILKDVIKGKPIDFEYAKEMVQIAKSLGIYVAANFIIGFPTETWDEIRETLRFAEDLQSDYVRIFSAIPLQKTRLWELCEKEGVFKQGYDHYNMKSGWSSGLIETDEFSANDLTVLRAYEWDRINFTDPAKRRKTAKRLEKSLTELNLMRRETIDSMYSKIL
jgi:radical SAM superfamily enzyme YgiQ (UPF0313 family)